MKSHNNEMHLSSDDAVATESFDNSNGDSAIKSHRFQPGKSGNLKGRPKGSKNHKTIISEIAAEKHRISTNNGNQSLTTIELLLLELRYHVASGNTVALRYYDTLQNNYSEPVSVRKHGVLVAPAQLTVEEWYEKCERENEKKLQAMLDEADEN